MKTYIYQNREKFIETEAMAKLIATASSDIEYKPCKINYENVKGLEYRDTYKKIEPFTDDINGTLFFKIDNEGEIEKLYFICHID